TNAGAAVVPTEKDMGKSLVVDGDKGANANDNKAPLAGDKPKDGTAADKPKDGPVNKDNTDGKNGNNNGGANGNPNATTPGKTGAATGVNEPGSKLTADGGYVDSNGKYHTPAELAAERAAGNTGTAANGNNANGGYVAGGTANGGTYAGGAVGNNNQIQLTNDGGFIDANGVKRGPAELAAYRATNAMQTGGDRPAPVTTNWGNIKEPITGPISIVKPIDVIQPPPVIIDPTKITTVNPIDTVARDLRNQGFIRAKNAGATDAEATASGAAAEAYFRNSIENGTEFTAAVTATNVSITTYINANFPGTYVAQPKPGVADPDNYADAVAAGTAAYTTAKNNGYGHSYAVGQGNIAYNSTLTSLEQDYEDDLFETDAANNDTVYTTAGVDIQDHINNSTAVSNPLLTQYVSGNYTQNLENAMDAAKASCSGCSYMDWDYWGHIQSNTSPSPMTDLQQQVVPYVYGDATLPANIPGTVGSPINAVYTGKSVLTTNGMHEIGNIQANITLSGAGSASLTGFQFNIPSQGATLSFGGSQAIGGTASFNNLSVSGSGFTGVVNGALFGPAAENVGGNMTYNNGGTVSGAGVYMGARP
ncbi:MAG: hypothetical protein K0R98_1424, partial [Rickettsiaceae bacterium]|nr:hypothetical protein [Rickettsiaceae bacterium]